MESLDVATIQGSRLKLETWAGSYYNGRGVAGMTKSFSTDGVNFSGDVTVVPAIISDGPAPFAPEVFALSAAARYVKLSVLSNHNDNDAHTGISEIKFTCRSDYTSPGPCVLEALMRMFKIYLRMIL